MSSPLPTNDHLPPSLRTLTEHDWLQIEQAAGGCIDGLLQDWPHLCAAIKKVRGDTWRTNPVQYKSVFWAQGYCEALVAARDESVREAAAKGDGGP